jgi:superfamily II DNA helicase RecQ
VYCGTRRDTEEIAGALRGTGLRALAYHAGMEGEERSHVQRRFMSPVEDAIDVVVATNAFGMGIDKANVRSVWHMTIPTSVEAYYQEAGRAGRDGLPSRAVLLPLKADLGRLVRFNEQRAGDPELAIAHERGWRAFRAVKQFVYGPRCRREALLAHFGDRRAETPPLDRCCDVCDRLEWLPNPETITARRPARAGASAAPGRSAPGPADSSEALPSTDAALFEALKKWRLQAAGGKPAYTVANNKTLTAIAVRRPADRADLIEISGVGPAFIDRYADDVLALVARYGSRLVA